MLPWYRGKSGKKWLAQFETAGLRFRRIRDTEDFPNKSSPESDRSSIKAEVVSKRAHVYAVPLDAVMVPTVLGARKAILHLERSGVMQECAFELRRIHLSTH
jgi:hypothetical protein